MTAKEEADKYFIDGVKYFYIDKIYERAKEYFTKAIELGANGKEIYRRRGFAYAEIKDYPEAIEDFTRAIVLGENDKSVYGARGDTYIYLGNYPKAIKDLTKVIEWNENNKDAYYSRGYAYAGMGKYLEAIEDFTTAIELGANDKDTYRNRGVIYARMGKYPEAIKDFTKALGLDANEKDIYRNRGFAYVGAKKHIKAIKDCTNAIKLGANRKDIYIIRGIAYIGSKKYLKAIKDFKKVIKLNKSGNEKNKNTDDNDNIYKKKLIDNTLNKIKLTDNILELIVFIFQKNESKDLNYNEVLSLIELIHCCYDLMEAIKIKPSEMSANKFVHYTKACTLQFLLQKDHTAKLRLNNAVYMNDPEEGQILKKVLCQLDKNNELENLFKNEDVKNYTYLACFSPYDKRDELPMWIHYGDGGKGVELVFHNSFFDKTDLYKVQYIDVKDPDINKLNQNVQEKITAILNLLEKDKIKNTDNKEVKDYVNIILNYVSYLFKDKAYEYENEVRILNYKDYNSQDIKTAVYESGISRLFIEYNKCISDENCVEVIAGPKANYTEIAAYAKYVGIRTVSKSEIKYR